MSHRPASHQDDHLDQEQLWHGTENRELRQDRKIAQRTDRSKYRKSDRDQAAQSAAKQVQPLSPHFHRGRVIEIRAGDIFVLCQHSPEPSQIGQMHLCRIRGSFKTLRSRTKNLVAVGDFVLYELQFQQEGSIQQILPRYSVLSRADNLNHQKEQILAANIDLLVIVVSLCEPTLNLNLIDRYLIAAAQGGLKPLLVINKTDLLDSSDVHENLRASEREKLNSCLATYSNLSFPVFTVCNEQPETLQPLTEVLKNKTCVFSGPSGVGKSTLITILSGKELRVQAVCTRTGRGTHTTSHSQLIALHAGGWCVDTPGIRSFALWQLDRSGIDQYFEEIAKAGEQCRFRDCQHQSEPGCEVRQAVEEGLISLQRYESYLNVMLELGNKHLRR